MARVRRWYICPVAGDGLMPETAWRPALTAGVVCSFATVIPANPDGSPRFAWCLAHVAAASHTALLADATLTSLPNLNLTDPLSSLSTAAKNAITAKLTQLGVTVDLTTATFGQMLRALGRKLDADFDEARFGLGQGVV